MTRKLKTDFTVSPYFDDYFNNYLNDENVPEELRETVENKGYVRILFKPATAVQARELTQIQTMLQQQIFAHASYFFRDGSVINGCDVNFYDDLDFIRCEDSITAANSDLSFSFTDIQTNYVIASFLNGSEIGVRAVPILVVPGQKENYPDTNVLYLRYISEGEVTEEIAQENTDIIGLRKRFFAGDELRVYNENQRRNRTLDENNFLFSVDVLNTVENQIEYGLAYAVNVGDGVIFQKGHFLKTKEQVGLVSKFDRNVDKKMIGYDTIEEIITSDDDDTLLSNAQGFPNENAPGADRLKLVPTLVSKNRNEVNEYVNFFPLVEFSGKQPYQINKGEEGLRKIRNIIAKRTSEESGDYSVFPFVVEPVPFDRAFPQSTIENKNDFFAYKINPGTIYCRGYRVSTINTANIVSRKGTDTKIRQNQEFTANYGNYVIVNEFLGSFDFKSFGSVDLYDSATQAITNNNNASVSASGNKIGTARVKALLPIEGDRYSPNSNYALYLFDVNMNPNKSFKDVRSIKADQNGVEGICDVVLQNGIAVLEEENVNTLLFETGYGSVKTLKPENNNRIQYNYTEVVDATLSNTSKQAEISITQNPLGISSLSIDGFSGSGADLTGIATNAFLFTLKQNTETIKKPDVTLDTYSGGYVISNTATGFEDFQIGDYIKIEYGVGPSTEIRRVVGKPSESFLYIDSNFDGGSNGVITDAEFSVYYPEGYVIDESRIIGIQPIGPTGEITSVILKTNLGGNLDFSSNSSVVARLPIRATGVQEIKKEILRNKYLKIDLSTCGDWGRIAYLGITDLASIEAIYVGETYSENNPDRKNWFIVDNGQKENFYDWARIVLKPQYRNRFSSTKNNKILIKLNYFKDVAGTGAGFYTVDSYPINDANTQPTEILTPEVPIFDSNLRNKKIDLRNSIDFRPKKENLVSELETADTPTDAPVIIFSGNKRAFFYYPNESSSSLNEYCFAQYEPNNCVGSCDGNTIDNQFPSNLSNVLINPLSDFEFDVEEYLPRIDHICVNFKGQFSIIEGTPSETPAPPAKPENLALIGSSFVPGYPSLTQRDERIFGRKNVGDIVTFEKSMVKRYTMRDINAIEKRIDRLEYYTTLNLLEQQVNDLTVLDENGLDRFKNGIFADSFRSHLLGKVDDIEYNVAIDGENGTARPIFQQNSADFRPNRSETTNLTGRNEYVLLDFEEETFIIQNYATKVRNCAALNYQWSGTVRLFPSFDAFKDTTREPVINVKLDLAAPLRNFVNEIGNAFYGEWRTVEENETRKDVTPVVTNVESDREVNQLVQTQTARLLSKVTTETLQEREVNNIDINVNRDKQTIGKYVTDISTIPYVRSRKIAFVAYGLKPNTRHYVFFDNTPVSEYCAPAELQNLDVGIIATLLIQSADEIKRTGRWGSRLISDSNGIIVGVYRIPEGEFLNGENEFLITNVENLETGIDAQISQATTSYNSSGIAVTKQRSTLTTRNPEIISSRTTQERTFTDERIDIEDEDIVTTTRIDIPQRTVTVTVNNNDGFDEPGGRPGDLSDPGTIDAPGSLGGTGPGGRSTNTGDW